MTDRKRPGTCNLCGGTFGRIAMTRHIEKCRKAQLASETSSTSVAEGAKSFHLFVEGRGMPEYWMHLEAPAQLTLKHLDDFLRDTWLECCGHLSQFTFGEQRYSVSPSDDDWFIVPGFDRPKERGMDVSLAKALKPGVEFMHEYDFGSTTELALRVIDEVTPVFKPTKRPQIRVLARNNPPAYPCDGCEGVNLAAMICTQCMYEERGLVCESCVSEHADHEEMLLPLVNSPRAGVCGYEG